MKPVKGLGAALAVVACVAGGCSSTPTPEEARALTNRVAAAHLEPAIPDGATVIERVEDTDEACVGELAPNVTIRLDVPEDVDLIAHLRQAWGDLGEVTQPNPSMVSVQTQGVRLTGLQRDTPEGSNVQATGPCTGRIR